MEGQEQAPKLLDQVRQVLRLHHYSIHTERSYLDWIKRYVRFHRMRCREDLADGERKIEAFLTDLAVRGKVAASTQNQAMNALVFLYRKVLDRPLDEVIDAVRAERKINVPVVLTREEVSRVIAVMEGVPEKPVTMVEPDGVGALEPGHAGDQVSIGRLHYHVVMIAHQAIRMNLPASLLACLGQRLEEVLSVPRHQGRCFRSDPHSSSQGASHLDILPSACAAGGYSKGPLAPVVNSQKQIREPCYGLAPLRFPILQFASGQNQTVRGEGLEIRRVNGRQFRAASNGHRRNHAVGQRTGTASGLVKQPGGQNRVGFGEDFRNGKHQTRQRFAGRAQRAAEILRPGNGADAKRIIGGGPLLKFCVRWRAGLRRLNQKVGVEMNHVLPAGVADGGHPGCHFLIIQMQVFLQGFERFERGPFWRHAGVPAGSGQDGEQSFAACRQLIRLGRNNATVVNLHFQREITHGNNLAVLAGMAN